MFMSPVHGLILVYVIVIIFFLQRNCLYFALTARPSLSYNPKFSLHQKLLDLVSHRFSNIIVFVALLLNIVILAMQVGGVELGHSKIY